MFAHTQKWEVQHCVDKMQSEKFFFISQINKSLPRTYFHES